MRMSACMRVCSWVCGCVCASMRVCVCACLHALTHASLHTCVRMRVHAFQRQSIIKIILSEIFSDIGPTDKLRQIFVHSIIYALRLRCDPILQMF